ncbi:MAG: DegV family protein [Clostridia bacterium]|nr:DegV family protein [Clostridia bacterium]
MIRIMTDSTCDLTPERREALGVEVAPLSVHFGPETFLDGETISNKEFYDRLRKADALPTTSQVNPEEFANRFRKHVENGDEVIGIFISSLLSGTCQSANIARDMVDEDKITVIDSGTVTFALGLLVEVACELRDQGKSAKEISDEIRRILPRVRILAVVDTLKYLKMGGRISGAAAVVGGMLGITPILAVKDGVVESPGKTRGRKAAFTWLDNRLLEEPVDRSLPVAFGHSDAAEALQDTMTHFTPLIGGARVCVSNIGSVVGTHAGPGAAGIAYFVRE